MYHVHEEIYNDFRTRGGFDDKKDNEETESAGFIASLCHQNYRKASWLVIYIVIGAQMAGVNIINIYTGTIFIAIDKNSKGGGGGLTAKA